MILFLDKDFCVLVKKFTRYQLVTIETFYWHTMLAEIALNTQRKLTIDNGTVKLQRKSTNEWRYVHLCVKVMLHSL